MLAMQYKSKEQITNQSISIAIEMDWYAPDNERKHRPNHIELCKVNKSN